MKKNWQKQKGLNLLEVLIALVIGLVILLGVVQVLSNSSIAYRMQDELVRLQDNGQFAVEYLAKDLRNTGFWGCLSDFTAVHNQLNPAGSGYNATFHGFAQNLNGTTSNGTGIIQAADTLTVNGVVNINGGTAVQMPYGPSTSSPVTAGSGSGLAANNIVFVGDCVQGDIFQVTGINASGAISHAGGVGSPGNVTGNLSKVYDGSANIYEAYTHIYNVSTDANGTPGLYITNASGTQVLVPDVLGFMILFGEDTDNDGVANVYVRASSVTNMDHVVSLRISLLLRTREDKLVATKQTYTFNGKTTTATDNRLYKVYTGTILLRNRST